MKASAFLLVLLARHIAALVPPSAGEKPLGRRGALEQIVTAVTVVAPSILTTTTAAPEPTNAFENKISNKYDDRPKRRGPKPPDLGVAPRTTIEGDTYAGLKVCGPAPNCFSSTIPVNEDPEHSIPAWIWPSGKDQEAAMEELHSVLIAYEPGQNGVDGGGFQIQKFDPKQGYIYVIMESLKNGYYDDVEFAVIPGYADCSVQVRSSSRIGYLDLGVNAKRLNFIAKKLKDKGWDAVGVDFATHRGYAIENEV